ncbi:MAG TPA: hypothetical protein PLS53_02070 [Thermoanaerobaculaceae bacterium]|nr:hypothetical protein [Thermoanaerobaculaceae bacterium]HPS76922.1 hypothetical protein [Thermoanaerobaculaceae bacterium]
MADAATLDAWRAVVHRLRQGPAPQGDRFDLCRRVLETAPHAPEAPAAVRMLLEGAMADALTDILDCQAVMAILRALDRAEVRPVDLLSHP